jgi:hypothetical protein
MPGVRFCIFGDHHGICLPSIGEAWCSKEIGFVQYVYQLQYMALFPLCAIMRNQFGKAL